MSGPGVAPQVPGEAAVAQAVGHAQVVAGSVRRQVALSHLTRDLSKQICDQKGLVQILQAWMKVPQVTR